MFFFFFIKANFTFVFVFNRQKWAFVDGKEPWCDIGSCVKKEDERFRFKSCQFVTRSTHQVDLKNWLNSDMSAHKYAFKTKLNGWKSHFAELFWLSVSHCSDIEVCLIWLQVQQKPGFWLLARLSTPRGQRNTDFSRWGSQIVFLWRNRLPAMCYRERKSTLEIRRTPTVLI